MRRGEIAERAQDYDRAVVEYSRALKSNPDNTDARSGAASEPAADPYAWVDPGERWVKEPRNLAPALLQACRRQKDTAIELVDARGLDDVPAGLRGVRTGVNLHGSASRWAPHWQSLPETC